MKFWIRINGLQEGPMEIERMKDYNVTPTTFVWCAGMKDWAYAKDVEDLKDIITWDSNDKEEECVISNQEPEVLEDSTSIQTEPTKVLNSLSTEKNEQEDYPNDVTDGDNDSECQMSSTEQAKENKKDERPCPSNNLIWAILCTIFCCQITGIIGIVLAALVSSKYEQYGYETAKKYSDWAGIMCIISVVLTIITYSIFFPLIMFFNLM